MKIYLASVNLGDKPNPRTPPHRLLSYHELNHNLFGAMDVFTKLSAMNESGFQNNPPGLHPAGKAVSPQIDGGIMAKKRRNQSEPKQEIKDPSIEIGPAEGLIRSLQGIAIGTGESWGYYFDERNKDQEDPEQWRYKSMYHKALKLEQLRVIQDANGFASKQPKEFLERLADEVRCRIKITQSEIFKVGEILITAKKVCQQNKIKFKDWINDNFDFSYETANNFTNVYKHCLGYRNIAMKMKPSLLYKVSSPGFPDELRDWLFEKGNLSKITNGKLTGLEQKFKQGGWEAVQEDVQELSDMGNSKQEISGFLDQFEDITRRIHILTEKMDHQGIDDLSYNIIMDLHKGLKKAYEDLQETKHEAINRFNTASQKTIDKTNDVIPLEMAS